MKEARCVAPGTIVDTQSTWMLHMDELPVVSQEKGRQLI
jgi:hypothetical protein